MNKLITGKSPETFNEQLEQHANEGWTSVMGYEVTVVNSGHVIYSAMMFKPDPPKEEKPQKRVNSPTIIKILEHRHKQIEVKGYDIKHDVDHNYKGQLLMAAQTLVIYNPSTSLINKPPFGWELKYWQGLMTRPYNDRMAIAASFICAEADRLEYLAEVAKA